jgi:hypothetical protein
VRGAEGEEERSGQESCSRRVAAAAPAASKSRLI